jgi:hypothetical protein
MKWAAALPLGLFGLLICTADRGALPHMLTQVYAFPGGDKLGHFLIALTLAYALNWALPGRRMGFKSKRILLGCALAALDSPFSFPRSPVRTPTSPLRSRPTAIERWAASNKAVK